MKKKYHHTNSTVFYSLKEHQVISKLIYSTENCYYPCFKNTLQGYCLVYASVTSLPLKLHRAFISWKMYFSIHFIQVLKTKASYSQ